MEITLNHRTVKIGNKLFTLKESVDFLNERIVTNWFKRLPKEDYLDQEAYDYIKTTKYKKLKHLRQISNYRKEVLRKQAEDFKGTTSKELGCSYQSIREQSPIVSFLVFGIQYG